MNKYDEWPSLRLYDMLDVPYVLYEFGDYGGPLWTGHCMMLNTDDTFGDEGFLHELFHWMMASPSARNYPDFRLGRWVNANSRDDVPFATSTVPTYTSGSNPAKPEKKKNQGWGEKVLDRTTGTFQEAVACNAMVCYHPLVGLTDWGTPPEGVLAADDFGAFFTLKKNGRPYVKEMREVYDHIVTHLASVEYETMVDHIYAWADYHRV